MHLIFFVFIFLKFSLNPSILIAESKRLDEDELRIDSEKIKKLSLEYAKFYEMDPNVEFEEITDNILSSSYVKEEQKISIQQNNRRFFIFVYPSDGLKIKGLISFVSGTENHPLLVFLRGGNRLFGIPNPGSDLMCFGNYTVLSTTYRGGVSEGKDEFGGDDVNDVKNLIDFIPDLEKKLNLNLKNQKSYLLGGSRGGMQMFLALSRFPSLQNIFSKVVSLSGLLDIQQCAQFRSDMEKMFINDFGLEKNVNEAEWFNKRNPILTIDTIQSQLPILIIQGTDDNRVSLEEGYNMVSQLQTAEKNVTYWEIEGAKHCLSNIEDRVDLILRWFEE